ncbi:MAG: hypothetical protein HUJ61_04835, partial [Bacilli bacterium]|nr:hypothetical protein [Bacilli bacterium]
MFNLQSDKKNDYMLRNYGKRGYDWWWHNFVGYNKKTGEERSFFIEYFIVNPGYKKDEPVFGQDSENKKNKIRPSYLMIKCGSWGKGKKQLHHFVGINKVEINDKPPFFVKADHFYADDKVLKGSVKVEKKHPDYMMCDDGTMSWNLKIEKVV